MATLNTTSKQASPGTGVAGAKTTGSLYANYTSTITDTELVLTGTVYLKSTFVAGPTGGTGSSASSSTNVTATNGSATKSFSNRTISHSSGGTLTSNVGTFTIRVPRKNTAQTITFTLSSSITVKASGATTASGTVSGSVTISLPALVKPTFGNDPMTYDTSFGAPYVGLTTASVYVKDMVAYGGAYIASALLTIGNQTAELTGTATEVLEDGTLSILLEQVGTFTPTIKVTDNRGQFETATLTPITILGYTEPQISIAELIRTDAQGTANDEGMCAVVTANFMWVDPMTDLATPTVVAEELNGTAVATTTTWYTDRALQNAISDWSTVSAMPIYGFIGNGNTPPNPFDTQDSFNITITPNDGEGAGEPVTVTLGSAFYTVDFLAGGHGIAFGKPASLVDYFECDLKALFNDSVFLALDTTEPPDTTTTDGQIYQALKDLGWDSDVIV